MIMAVLLSYIQHLSYEIWKYSVWYFWKNGHLSSGITTSWPASQSDAKLLEGGVVPGGFSMPLVVLSIGTHVTLAKLNKLADPHM